MKHYQALAAAAAELALPQTFKTDLTKHDRAALAARDENEPFGWVISEYGTWLFIPGARDNAGNTVDRFPKFYADAHAHLVCHWFWWNGCALEKVRRPTLEARLEENCLAA
jgi:hypothetical protein